jgi:hypothetical protein
MPSQTGTEVNTSATNRQGVGRSTDLTKNEAEKDKAVIHTTSISAAKRIRTR